MNKQINTPAAKRIAVVAGNNKRKDLVEWSYFNNDILNQHRLTAIDETADVLEGTLNGPVNRLFTRDTGGYQQLATLIENGKIDILFFFADPSMNNDKDTDLKKVLLVAAKKNIMVACNEATTELVMTSVLQRKDHPARLRSYPGFLKQTVSFINQLALKHSAAAM